MKLSSDVMIACNVSMIEQPAIGRLVGYPEYRDAVDYLMTKPRSFEILTPDNKFLHMNFDHVTMIELDRNHAQNGLITNMARIEAIANIMGGSTMDGELKGIHSLAKAREMLAEQPGCVEMIDPDSGNSAIINFDHVVFFELTSPIRTKKAIIA